MAHRFDTTLTQLLQGEVEADGLRECNELWADLRDVAVGGKQFRPLLVLTAHDALGGQQPRAAHRVAAATELLHTALLAHDDVIDDDAVRRSRPNVSGRHAVDALRRGLSERSAHRYGEAAGILAGDLALVRATCTIATCGAPAETVGKLLELFDTTIDASAAGELADVRLGWGLTGAPVTVTEAVRVAEQKTAAYSFRFPLRAGALLADAPPAILEPLDATARRLGIGFQLVDDLLGVFGDETVTGKSVISDLREGKGTALIAAAATTEQWPELQPLLGAPDLDDAGAARARDLLVRCGARRATEELAERHLTEAEDLTASLPEDLGAALTTLSRTIRERIPTPAASTPRCSESARRPAVLARDL